MKGHNRRNCGLFYFYTIYTTFAISFATSANSTIHSELIGAALPITKVSFTISVINSLFLILIKTHLSSGVKPSIAFSRSFATT